MTIEGVNQPT